MFSRDVIKWNTKYFCVLVSLIGVCIDLIHISIFRKHKNENMKMSDIPLFPIWKLTNTIFKLYILKILPDIGVIIIPIYFCFDICTSYKFQLLYIGMSSIIQSHPYIIWNALRALPYLNTVHLHVDSIIEPTSISLCQILDWW